MIKLSDLPAPLHPGTGWPWSQDVEVSDEFDVDLPPITIVTPSYNQGRFIEATIRSVLLQGYPRLQYIIMDGGSTDETVAVIHKYADWIDLWVSEPDGGQSNAINKGFVQATGDVINWLNSDDILRPGALFQVARAANLHPDAGVWTGSCQLIDEVGEPIRIVKSRVNTASSFAFWGNPFDDEDARGWIPQPSCFYRRTLFNEVDGVREDLRYTMDVELWLKMAGRARFHVMPEVLSSLRWHDDTITLEDYPARMVEHVGIAWDHGDRAAAREKIVEYGVAELRSQFLGLEVREFTVLVATWLYRRLIKQPLGALVPRRSRAQ